MREAFILVVLAGGIGVLVWSVVDAASRTSDNFRRIGSNKVTWIVLPLGGALAFGVLGLGLAGYYLVRVRPRLQAAST